MTKQNKQIRDCGEILKAHAKVTEIGESKIKAGEVNLGSMVQSFANAGYRLESFFIHFNEVAEDLVKRGLEFDEIINEYMSSFNEKAHYFKEISSQINKTSLKDNLLSYFPQELSYIAQRN